jgi:hypothetical protein
VRREKKKKAEKKQQKTFFLVIFSMKIQTGCTHSCDSDRKYIETRKDIFTWEFQLKVCGEGVNR